MRAIHNKKPSQPEKDIEEYENNDRVEILASDLDNASKQASLSKMCKPNFHWTYQNESFNSIHSPADEWIIEDFFVFFIRLLFFVMYSTHVFS